MRGLTEREAYELSAWLEGETTGEVHEIEETDTDIATAERLLAARRLEIRHRVIRISHLGRLALSLYSAGIR